MTDTQVLKLCRRAERLLRPVLGIGPEWKIGWQIPQGDGATDRGHVALRTEYREATIRIWPRNHSSHADLVDTMAHELVHVSQWPFYLYARHVDEFTPETHRGTDGQAWTQAVEQHVCAVVLPSAPVQAVMRELRRGA